MKCAVGFLLMLLALSSVAWAIPTGEIFSAFQKMESRGNFSVFERVFAGHLRTNLFTCNFVTLFVPNDSAFDNDTLAYFNRLNGPQLGLVAKYHATPDIELLRGVVNVDKSTLARVYLGSLKVHLKVDEDNSTLSTLERTALVIRPLAFEPHLYIYEISKVLIPSELLKFVPPIPPQPQPGMPQPGMPQPGMPQPHPVPSVPSPVPAPSSESTPVPSPAPGPSTEVSSPAPAPATEVPSPAPATAPTPAYY